MKKLAILAAITILVSACAKQKHRTPAKRTQSSRAKLQQMISPQMPYDYFVDAKTPEALTLDAQPKRACKDEDIAQLAQDERQVEKLAFPAYQNIDLAKRTIREDKIKTKEHLLKVSRHVEQTQSYCKVSLANPIDIAGCSKVAVTSAYKSLKELCEELAKLQSETNALLISITPPIPN